MADTTLGEAIDAYYGDRGTGGDAHDRALRSMRIQRDPARDLMAERRRTDEGAKTFARLPFEIRATQLDYERAMQLNEQDGGAA